MRGRCEAGARQGSADRGDILSELEVTAGKLWVELRGELAGSNHCRVRLLARDRACLQCYCDLGAAWILLRGCGKRRW